MSDFVEVRHILSVILHRWWLVIICVAMAGLIGYRFSQSQQPIYRATARMAIAATLEANALKYSEVEAISQQIRTYADLAIRQPVLEAVIAAIPLGESWQQLQDRVRVTPIETSQMLEISVESPSREEAILVADEVARQLLRLNLENDQRAAYAAKIAFAQARLLETEKEIDSAQAQLNELRMIKTTGIVPNPPNPVWSAWLNTGNAINLADPGSEESQQLMAAIVTAEKEIIEWGKEYNRWEITVQTNSTYRYFEIIEAAQAGQTPVRPQTQVNVIIFSGIGLTLALGLIALLEQLSRSIKVTDNFAQRLQLPVIGTIRPIRGNGYSNRLSFHRDPIPDVSKDYGELANRIQLLCPQTPKLLLVAGPNGGEGRSTLVAHLGIALAQSGYRTMIIDADWRQPVQHEFFQVPNNQGLLQLLSNQTLASTTPLWAIPQFPNLHLITSGTLATHYASSDQTSAPVNPVEKLNSRQMTELLAYLSEQADVIIIDTPPVLKSSVTVTLAGHVDGVILMAEMKNTTWDALLDTKDALQRTSAYVLGLVLNRTTAKINNQNSRVLPPVLANDHTARTAKVTPVIATAYTNGVTGSAQADRALPQRSDRVAKRVIIPKHLPRYPANPSEENVPAIMGQIPSDGSVKRLTFAEAGIQSLLLNGTQESATVQLPDTWQWVPAHGDQLQLELLGWLDESAIETNGHVPYASIEVVLDGIKLGAVPLEHNGPQAAILSIPQGFVTNDKSISHALQLTLRSHDIAMTNRGLIVVIRPTSSIRYVVKPQVPTMVP